MRLALKTTVALIAFGIALRALAYVHAAPAEAIYDGELEAQRNLASFVIAALFLLNRLALSLGFCVALASTAVFALGAVVERHAAKEPPGSVAGLSGRPSSRSQDLAVTGNLTERRAGKSSGAPTRSYSHPKSAGQPRSIQKPEKV